MFTRAELDVLFHVLNNAYGDAFNMAAARAEALDGMNRDEFIRTYSFLISKISNMEPST